MKKNYIQFFNSYFLADYAHNSPWTLLRNKHLKFKTSRKILIIIEESMEYISN